MQNVRVYCKSGTKYFDFDVKMSFFVCMVITT